MAVSGLSSVAEVGAGELHSLARSSSGSVYAWGYGANGQLGAGDWQSHTSPVQVKGIGGSGYLAGITALGTGLGDHSLAIGSAGAAFAWGSDLQGQLGDDAERDTRNTPTQVVSINGIVSLGMGSLHSLAVTQPRRTTTSYAYDKLYRLTEVSTDARVNDYTYDPAGNRSTRVYNGSSSSYSYDRADRLLSVGSTAYVVNAAGDTLGRGGGHL